MNELGPLKRLALSYSPRRSQQATLGLLALDDRLAAILRGRREPLATQLRLAWWREMLERPPAEWPHGDPVLDSLSTWRDPSGLAVLAEGWEALLAERLTSETVADFVHGRSHAFACLAQELGEDESSAGEAAALWALADLAANLSDSSERTLVLGHDLRRTPPALPGSMRSLAVLAGLGARALRRGGSGLLDGPGSVLLALRIGLTGR